MVRLSAGQRKKLHILGVCKKLFYRNGYDATTYQDICREADIPPGTITYHFGSKRGLAAAIDAEYEAHNKIYIEKMCGDAFDKTTLMVIENYHMWKRNFEVPEIKRFLISVSTERLPSISAADTVKYYYRCVMDDQGIDGISDKELDLIVAAQLGMSDALLIAANESSGKYTWEDAAEFGIRFFMRQIGIPDDQISKHMERGRAIFETLPIDNRYYKDFAYNDRYITRLEA